MLYIQVTQCCNMDCAHCYANASRTGQHMPLDLALRAVDWGIRTRLAVTIGGGEPTLHPDFWAILDAALKQANPGYVRVVTNGSVTKDALKLARLGGQGKIWAVLSQDEYHLPINPKVVAAFDNPKALSGCPDPNDLRCLWRPPKIIASGRALGLPEAVPGCICDTPFMDVEGGLWMCGCKEVSCGHLDDYIDPHSKLPDYSKLPVDFGNYRCPHRGESLFKEAP